MIFFENVKRALVAEHAPQPFFSATLIDDYALFLEGVKEIKEFGEKKIVAILKKGELEVLGEGLFIKKYFEGDLVVCGKIREIRKI